MDKDNAAIEEEEAAKRAVDEAPVSEVVDLVTEEVAVADTEEIPVKE
jgi:hypothetical protein